MYFNHPYALRNTPEILELRSELGFQAYAIYLMVLETIAESKEQAINGKLVNGLSISFGCDVEFLKKVLTRATELKLFFVKGDFIFSTHLQQHFEKRAEIKQKRIEAGAKGGNAKANAKQNLANPSKLVANAKQNLPKESKESKINKNKEIIQNFYQNFDDVKILIQEVFPVLEGQEFFEEQAKQVINLEKENMIAYYTEGTGKGTKKEIKYIKRTFKNWIKDMHRSKFYLYKKNEPSKQNEPNQQTFTLSRSKFSSDKEYENEIRYYQEHHKDWKLILAD